MGDGMKSYKTVHHRSRFEYEDRKSVFIGEAMPVSTEADALAFIERARKKYSSYGMWRSATWAFQ